MQINDPIHASEFCYRRRQEAPIRRKETMLTGEDHVANVLSGCGKDLMREAVDFCSICDSTAAKSCIFDACAVGTVMGAMGSRDHCQRKLLIAAKPGQEKKVCAEQMWDSERQMCRNRSWSPEAECAPGAECGGAEETSAEESSEEADCSDKDFAQTCVQSFLKAGGCSLMGKEADEREVKAALSSVDPKCFVCESVGSDVKAACENQKRSPMDILREIIDDAAELQKADLPERKNELNELKRTLGTATKSLGRSRLAINKALKKLQKAKKPKQG